jgi:hypothetical protein
MGRFDKPQFTKDDFELSVDPKEKELRVYLPKGDRRYVFDADAPKLEDLVIQYRKAQNETKRLKTEMDQLVKHMQDALKVRDINSNEVRNLIEILEAEGYALDDRKKKVEDLTQYTLRIQSKENIMTFSKVFDPRINYSEAWKKLVDFLTVVNEANDKTKGSQNLLLEIMSNILEKTKTPMGRRFLGVTRIRKRKNVQESFDIGETISSIWKRVKSTVMSIASRMRKNTYRWLVASEEIEEFLNRQKSELTMEMRIMKNKRDIKTIREKYENPRITSAGFDLDVDEKNKELRIGIPKSRREHYDTHMDAAEKIQLKIAKAKNDLKKLGTEADKLRKTADEVLRVAGDNTEDATDLLKVLDENQEQLLDLGDNVEKLADLTIRIQSNKYSRTLSKVPERSPDYKVVIQRLQNFLQTIDEAVVQNEYLLEYIDHLIEQSKKEKDTPARRDYGVKKLGESLLHEFRAMKSIALWWERVKSKFKMLISKLRRMNDEWENIGKELNSILAEFPISDNRSLREGKSPNDKIQVGSKVKYSVKFLRSTGEYTGVLPRARGTVIELQPLGDRFLAVIDWGRYSDDVPNKVLTSNLALESDPESRHC